MTLVTFIVVAIIGSVFVNATDNNDITTSNFQDQTVEINIESPSDGAAFLEPLPLQTTYVDIHIVNQFDKPIYDAWIHVYEQGQGQGLCWEGFTDMNGRAYWPRPNVDRDTKYRVKAEKYVNGEYLVSFVYVTIKNRCLKVSTNVNPVYEGSNFYCIVKNQNNQPVSMATVKFNGEIKLTDSNGKTSLFKSPWVDKDTTFSIKASASVRGYDNGYYGLTVRDRGDPSPRRIYGQVRDYDFKPLQNVKITVTKGSYAHVTYTDKDGEYSTLITPKEGGQWVTIKASYPGCPTQSVKRWIDGVNTNPININFWIVEEGYSSS